MAAEAAVAAAERALYDAMIAKDLGALADLLAPDLTYIHSTGVAEDRERYLAEVRRDLYDYRRIESRETATAIDGDLAVTRGLVDMEVATAGAPAATVHLRFVLVWARRDGRWQLSLRQATRLP